MADRPTRLRVELLEERRLLSAAPVLDLNGAAPGADFAVERADHNGLVALVSHELAVSDADSPQLTSATVSIAAPLAGDTFGALVQGTNITASYANGVLQLSGADTPANYQQVLRTVRFNSTAARSVGDQVDVSFSVNDGQLSSNTVHSIVTVIAQGTGAVVGRYLFYNNSKYDGDDPAANAADDLAIASDKQALVQGQTATAANYSNYNRGINGLMIDLTGPHGPISADDLIFQLGNNNYPDTWHDAPAPLSVTTRAGAGQGGSDRVEITWADGAIANQWLQVVVAANSHTGLATPDTFLFGNSVGESGNSTADARVTAVDVNRVVNRLLRAQTAASANDPLDFSRDGLISAYDALLAAHRVITNSPDVNLINVAAIPSGDLNSTTSTGVIVTIQQTHGHFTVIMPPTIAGRELLGGTVNLEPTEITLRMPVALSTVGGNAGAHSALNLANYRLFKNDVEQPAAIVSAAIQITRSGAGQSSDVTLTFAAPLTAGNYRVVALGTICDEQSQPIDGQQSNTPGSDYSTTFTVSRLVRDGDSSVVTQATVYAQQLATLPGGDVVVAWAQYGGSNSGGGYPLYVQRLTASRVPVGTPQLVSQYSLPNRIRLSVDGAGDVTVVWTDNGILARRFSANLDPLGDTFRVDPPDQFGGYRSIDDSSLDVVTGPQGGWIASWIVQGFNLPNQWLARRFDASGQPLAGAITLSTDAGSDAASPPRMAVDAVGNLAAVWTKTDPDANRLVGRLFDSFGEPLTDEFTIQQSTDGTQPKSPSITRSPQGDFVVTWINTLDSHSEVLVRRFNSIGDAIGGAITVDRNDLPITPGVNWTFGGPQVVFNALGGFTIVWQASHAGSTGTPSQSSIDPASAFYARVYDSAGNAQTPATDVTTDQFTDPRQNSVATIPYVPTAAATSDEDGQLLVAWTQNDAAGSTLRVQKWWVG